MTKTMTTTQALLTRAVRDTYAGDDGCACGCGGTYSSFEDRSAKVGYQMPADHSLTRRRITRAAGLWDTHPTDGLFSYQEDGETVLCLGWVTGQKAKTALGTRRVLRLYLRAADLGLTTDQARRAGELVASGWTGGVGALLNLAAAQ